MSAPVNGQRDYPAMLDAYLDGVLSGQELASFEAELARNPALGEQLELHRRIETSIRGAFRPEDVALPAIGATTGPALAGWRQSALYRIVMLGAAAAILLVAGILTYSALNGGHSFELKQIRPDALYAKVVDAGFKPEWKCTSDAEFAETVRYRLRQPLMVAEGVPGLEVLGWAYPEKYKGTPLSDRAMILLSTVDGKRVLVVIDRAEADKELKISASGLHLFKRRVDDLILYEITPKDKPVVIEAMYRPETIPEEKPAEPGHG